ncbi:MAG: CAP domain-containing protein [Deltaproteobacteria bacterium]|nr:CAP domain-containing protein [Deltaproteobacteria bacterium]
MRTVYLFAACLLLPLAATTVALDASPAAAQDRAGIDAERDRLLAMINAYRAEHGAPPLRLSATLQRAAEGHSGDMAARDYFDHETPEGVSPAQRARAAGYPSGFVGENLAAGNAGAQATFTQWRNSPAHDRGMRDPRYRAVGLGYVARRGSRFSHYWTMLMGDRVDVPLGAPAPAVPSPSIPGIPGPAPGTSPDDDMWPGADASDDEDCETDGDDDGSALPPGSTTPASLPGGWMMGPFGFPIPAIPGWTQAIPGAAAPTTPAGPRPRATVPTVDLQQLLGLLQSLGRLAPPAQ